MLTDETLRNYIKKQSLSDRGFGHPNPETIWEANVPLSPLIVMSTAYIPSALPVS